jgi:hypothetical protein
MNMRPNEESAPGILLGRMPQQTEVRAQEDDWTGRTDAATRRKLQNRLNQRIYRKHTHEDALLVFAPMDGTVTLPIFFQEVGVGQNGMARC